MFGKLRKENLNAKEFNEKLRYIKKYFNIHINEEPKSPLGLQAYLIDKITKIELTFKDPLNKNKPCTYIFDKACSAISHEAQGCEAYATLQKYFKIPHVADKSEALEYFPSVSGILYYNKKRNQTRNYAYGYDMNSAFSWAMLQEMPKDTEKGPINKLKDGTFNIRRCGVDEIGFDSLGNLVTSGGLAEYIFKKENSPFTRFVNTWYDRKKNAKTTEEKIKAKDILVMSVGFMQRHNFWYRAAIIGYCNRFIRHIIKKYGDKILLSNTDSIVSTCKLPELETNLGREIGQWKFEHEGYFAYNKMNYQWDFNAPTYRGTAKTWFKENYDILKDDRPTFGNFYKIDYKKLKLVKEEINNEEEKY